MSLEISSDDVLALVENIEEWFLLDKSGLRSRVSRLRDRIRALEAENAQLRAALARASRDPSEAPDRAERERREPSTDPWAIPGESEHAAPVLSPTTAPRRGARFACQRCGEMHEEASLQRVDGALVCEACNVRKDDPPVRRGSYR